MDKSNSDEWEEILNVVFDLKYRFHILLILEKLVISKFQVMNDKEIEYEIRVNKKCLQKFTVNLIVKLTLTP
ncbi:MAG TPA: hypothetical protein VK087_07175 [Tissierellaceae bacterium]|nr:hypothetical protein [Tissierellaceae bacterium]